MMAGQRKRRNKEALIRRSLMSRRPRLPHSCRQDAKTSFSSRGKTLLAVDRLADGDDLAPQALLGVLFLSSDVFKMRFISTFDNFNFRDNYWFSHRLCFKEEEKTARLTDGFWKRRTSANWQET